MHLTSLSAVVTKKYYAHQNTEKCDLQKQTNKKRKTERENKPNQQPKTKEEINQSEEINEEKVKQQIPRSSTVKG